MPDRKKRPTLLGYTITDFPEDLGIQEVRTRLTGPANEVVFQVHFDDGSHQMWVLDPPDVAELKTRIAGAIRTFVLDELMEAIKGE